MIKNNRDVDQYLQSEIQRTFKDIIVETVKADTSIELESIIKKTQSEDDVLIVFSSFFIKENSNDRPLSDKEIANIFKKFNKKHIKIPQYILEQYSKRSDVSKKNILNYLTKIDYNLGIKEKRALKLFLKLE